MTSLLQRKLDITEFRDQIQTKLNKTDHEISSRQIDMIQKQLESIALLFVQYIKEQLGASDSTESVNQRKNRLVNILNKALIVSNWLQRGDTDQLNSVFDNSAVVQQNNMFQDLQSNTTQNLLQLTASSLSPNKNLNAQVKRSVEKLLVVPKKAVYRDGSFRSKNNKTLETTNHDLKEVSEQQELLNMSRNQSFKQRKLKSLQQPQSPDNRLLKVDTLKLQNSAITE